MIDPYQSYFVSVYFVPILSPVILRRFWISGFSIIWVVVASQTLSIFPFKGKEPYLSLVKVSIPASAKDLAESPSVRIKMHSSDFPVPAQLASSSLSIPITHCFFPPAILLSFALSLASAILTIVSMIPELR